MTKSDISLIKERMTSIDLSKLVNRRHSNVLRDIREMSSSWLDVTGQEFEFSNYVDSTGRTLPMFNLKKSEILFIVAKYDDNLRAMIIIRLEQLENEKLQLEKEQNRCLKRENDKLWDESDRKDLYRR